MGDTESELTVYLQSNGLDDVAYWKIQLKELGVRSKTSLQLIERNLELFLKLEKKARNYVEKVALKKLLYIEELEKEQRQKMLEKEEKRKELKLENEKKKNEKFEQKKQEVQHRIDKEQKEREELEKKAQKLLDELERAQIEGKERHDTRVQRLENDIRLLLQIPPETWISKNKSLEELIEGIKVQYERSTEIQERDWLNDSMLLRKCSSGRALQGVLVSKKLSDQLEARSALINVPDDVEITNAALLDETTKIFSSIHDESDYKKMVDILGHSVAASGSATFYRNVKVGASVSQRSEEEREHQHHKKEMYSSRVECSTMHVASCTLSRSDLKLSKDVRHSLSELSTIISSHGKNHSGVHDACIKIFNTYGSHATLGPFSFGGHFWLTCSSKGFSESKRETVKKMQTEAISASAGFSFLGFGASTEVNIDKTKGKYLAEFTENTLASTRLHRKIIGGPLEATDISKWKSGLLACNSTWIVTDRGKTLIPLWEIIKQSHHMEFGHLTRVLRSSWERMTGLKADQDLLELLPNSEYVLSLVSNWTDEKSLSPRQLKDRLEYLLRIKQDIVEDTCDMRYWFSAFLTKSTLQKFLLLIVDAKFESSVLEDLKFSVKQLVDKEELSQLNTLNFARIEDFSKWLYPPSSDSFSGKQENITDFSSFDLFLQKILRDILMPGSSPVSETELAQKVQYGVSHLRLLCRKSYDKILISILLYHYQYDSYDEIVRLKPLSVPKLMTLKEKFLHHKKKFDFYKDNPFRLQCFLLLLAMEHSLTEKSSIKKLMDHTVQMLKGLDPPLDSKLSDHINTCCRGHLVSEYTQLRIDLQSAIQSGKLHEAPSISDNSLKKVLQTKSQTPQSQTLCEDMSVLFKLNKNAHGLFKLLGLCKYYPQKIKLQDALCIRPKLLDLSLNCTPPSDLTQLPFLVLHKLMSYDFECRSDLLHVVDKKGSKPEESHSNLSCSSSESEDEAPEVKINPVDCLLALIVCSDDFLWHDLFSRLAKCQLAIPFLLPDPFTKRLQLPLWAMCSITKDWKVEKSNNETEQHSHPIVDYPMPVISFMKFGKRQRRGASKSQILNEVISETSRQDFFFTRDCPGGQYPSILLDGLVDMCIYFPTKEVGNAFPDAIAFLNLHGDAKNHSEQVSILSQISSMCFILVTEADLKFETKIIESLQNFSRSPGGITILNDTAEESRQVKKSMPGLKLHVTDLESKNDFEVKDSIRKRINSKQTGIMKELSSIKSLCTKLESDYVDFDNNSISFQEGHHRAAQIKETIIKHRDERVSAKEVMLPLQGKKYWKPWAVLDKELHRHIDRGKEIVEDYNEQIETQKDVLRNSQLSAAESLTPVMKSFMLSLLTLGGPENRTTRSFFLQCLKLELNNLSSVKISGMQREYQSAHKELSNIQGKVKAKSSVKPHVQQKIVLQKNKLVQLREKIVEFSFGLEHFFRELGQVYEAALQSKKYKESLSCLPKAAAELLIDGHPLELMDGDASHVPLHWFTAVLNEVVEILGDPKVFVLSVLGLQSSGKSTLLNTVFGVQFSVSAGRCTRGAFMQLVPFDDKLKSQTQCSHALIVDTEGLRAPELDPLTTNKHDNELATFVIGLAKTTLINITGEVTGDMDDILQTSVHAFLRMTEVKYHPSCMFVHHNATVNIKSEVGRAKFVEKLNRFTREAAEEEKCGNSYETFDSIIHFNEQTDVIHFPGLWKGDPPMAPVNTGYSIASQKLKQKIVKKVVNCECQSLSTFKKQIKDLWNALMEENFIFSFKNNLEISAYRSLETQFGEWSWRFQDYMLQWEQTTGNEINSEAIDTVNELVKQKIDEVKLHANKQLYEPIKEEMEAFFKGKHSEQLIQWKGKYQLKLEELPRELIEHAEKYCKLLLDSKQTISDFQKARKDDAKFIKEKVQENIKIIRLEKKQLNDSLEKGKLKSKQLELLLKKNLFTPDKLTQYSEDQVITPKQRRKIDDIIRANNGQLNLSSLNQILVGDVLSTNQVKDILERFREPDDELVKKFEDIWIDLTNKLSPVKKEPVNVEDKIQKALITHFKMHEGQLLRKMRSVPLRKWGQELTLKIKKAHYEKVATATATVTQYVPKFIVRWCRGSSDPCEIEAMSRTEEIFYEVEKYLNATTKRDTDFNSALVTEMLKLISVQIDQHTSAAKERFSFTQEYRLDVGLVACSYSIPMFIMMAKLFAERNDPLIYLEKHVREPMFTLYKDQYNQTQVEEAIANSLCAHLKEPIREQISQSIGRVMVTKMKGSDACFKSKMALKVKILTDLHEKNSFHDYVLYLKNVRQCLERHLKKYAIEFCDENAFSGSTKLQITAKEEVTELIYTVSGVITCIHHTTIDEWLSSFCNNQILRSKLGLKLEPNDIASGIKTTEQLDLDSFRSSIKGKLSDLKDALHLSFSKILCEDDMENWSKKPHEMLSSLVGCTAQCPFCGEQCDLLDPDHLKKGGNKHQTEIHRMDCLAGWRDKKTQVMCTGFCPAYIDSDREFYKSDHVTLHPYKRYREVYPDWSIPPDKTAATSLYWKWFVGKYSEALANEFKAKPPKVQPSWKKLNWIDIEANLKEIYQI